MRKNEVPYFSTGCDLLDMVVGGAENVFGYPAGKFINIVGDKSAGKTFLANELIAAAYHRFGKKEFRWIYDDCESGYSFNTKEMYGVEIMPEGTPRSETVEKAFCNISDFADSLKAGQFGIYVIDSLDGLGSIEAEKMAQNRLKAHKAGKEFDEGSYRMGKPKYLSQEFFPQLCNVVQDKNILVVIISQVRENIDPFSFEKYKRNGGKSMDFYAHSVLWLATLKKVAKKSRSVGVVVKAKMTKSKTPRPFRECMFTLLFDYGLDNTGTCLDFLYELRTDKGELQPASKSLSWGGEGTPEKPNTLKIKKWMKEIIVEAEKSPKGKRVTALERYKETNERVTLDGMIEFINSNEFLKEKYDETFGGAGIILSREKLIEYIENDEIQKELLKKLVQEKWEKIEHEVKSHRRKRYGSQPRTGEE